MSIVAKQWPISATAELLSSFMCSGRVGQAFCGPDVLPVSQLTVSKNLKHSSQAVKNHPLSSFFFVLAGLEEWGMAVFNAICLYHLIV